MLRRKKEGIEWLEFELLADIPHLSHAVFLRHSGTSTGPFSSLNFGLSVGDDPEAIHTHKKQAARLLGLPSSHSLAFFKQRHGTDIIDIPSDHQSEPIPKAEAPSYDAITTQAPGIGLMIKHADCQATIFYDPQHQAIANVHCGWRGNVQNIYAKVVQHMGRKYGSHPHDLLVCIGPSLGPDSSEFIHYRQELPEAFWEFQVKPTYFDLWAISRQQLIEQGVLNHHIEIASLDTYKNPHDFYSHRREKPSGRHATIVALKQR